MPSGSDLQDSIDKTREAFRRSSVDGLDDRPPRMIPAREDAPAAVRRDDEVSDLHPFFQGLLDTLPEPGADWPVAKRDQWLETARNIFALVYRDPAENVVAIRPVRPTSDVAPAEPRYGQQSA